MSKGQSAIEYLATYGWMLLVIAIVGGAIFTTIEAHPSLDEDEVISTAENITDRDFCRYEGRTQVDCFNNRTIENTTVYTNPVQFNVINDNGNLTLEVKP